MSDEQPDYLRDLQVEENLGHERRQWRAHTVTGAVTVVVLTFGVLGLFGSGPLSWATATGDAGVLVVDYERFLRHNGGAELQVHVAAEAADQDTFQLEVDRDYVDAFEITTITPEPDSVETLRGKIRFTFATGDPTANLDVSFEVKPMRLWRHRGEMVVPGRDSVRYWQFTFP